MTGWNHDEARRHTVVERLHERCITYAGATCPDRRLVKDEWCERCLAVAEIEELRELLVEIYLFHPQECWFDHHGYCQEHGWMDDEVPCPYGVVRRKGLVDE